MSIELIDKIKPKNNGAFALVDAHDVAMPDGTRLDTWEGGGGDIPTFDLVALGLPTVPMDGTAVSVETDTAEILEALETGAVRFSTQTGQGGAIFQVVLTVHDVVAGRLCSGVFEAFGVPLMMTILVEADKITATCIELQISGIPSIDLVALGLPTVPTDGTPVSAEMDTAEMMAALDKGPVKFAAKFSFGTIEMAAEIVMNKVSVDAAGMYICSYALDFDGLPMIFNLMIQEGMVVAFYTNLAKASAPAASVDLSGLDSEGKIVETYADGTTKTTTIESDENGNPVKITDGDGNVTTLIW